MTKPAIAGTFSFPHEAQIARSSLEAAGIPAVVADEHTINMQWLYSDALGGVKVLVPVAFEEEAKQILATDFSQAVEEAVGETGLTCSACGSSELEPFTKGKRSAFVVFLLLGFPFFFYKHGYRCIECGEFIET
jgi:hypothetical protein